MKRILFWMLMVPVAALAQDATDGATALRLSQELLCSTYDIISGNLGLMVGFLVAAFGLYKLIDGDMKGGVIYILIGAFFTATPGLILSFFDGMGLALGDLSTAHEVHRPGCIGN